MFDLGPAFRGEKTVDEILDGVTVENLRELTSEMVDTIWGYMADCRDADVVFQPIDPEADDPFAEDDGNGNLAWTLGHVVVHVTATAEEAATLAAEMARGVERAGRSRSEVAWESVTSIEQCRQRLQESRRMQLASLDMWPDKPNLEIRGKPWPTAPEVNAIGRFVFGLAHAWDHFDQIQEVVRQAKVVRS